MNSSEIASAKILSREILALVERNDYGGRYEQALRAWAKDASNWSHHMIEVA